MKYSKYHSLGNDYIVFDPAHGISLPGETEIQTICHRNYGVGSDGIIKDKISKSKRVHYNDNTE